MGSLIGVVVAFSLWRFNKRPGIPTDNNTQPSTNSDSEVETRAETNNGLSIVFPQNKAVVNKDVIKLTGFSAPNTLVGAVSSSPSVTLSNASGEFALDLELGAGVNQVTVWVFQKGLAPINQTITVIYSEEIEITDRPATAIFGAVTDIAEETLQVRSENGQIEQLSLSPETTYASIINKPAEIKFSDVAIGDYVVALGFLNDNKVLGTSRVLVTSESSDSVKTAISGKVKTLTSREFLVDSYSGDEVSVDAIGGVTTSIVSDNEIKAAKLTNAEEGQEIAIIGELKSEELVAERIILQ